MQEEITPTRRRGFLQLVYDACLKPCYDFCIKPCVDGVKRRSTRRTEHAVLVVQEKHPSTSGAQVDSMQNSDSMQKEPSDLERGEQSDKGHHDVSQERKLQVDCSGATPTQSPLGTPDVIRGPDARRLPSLSGTPSLPSQSPSDALGLQLPLITPKKEGELQQTQSLQQQTSPHNSPVYTTIYARAKPLQKFPTRLGDWGDAPKSDQDLSVSDSGLERPEVSLGQLEISQDRRDSQGRMDFQRWASPRRPSKLPSGLSGSEAQRTPRRWSLESQSASASVRPAFAYTLKQRIEPIVSAALPMDREEQVKDDKDSSGSCTPRLKVSKFSSAADDIRAEDLVSHQSHRIEIQNPSKGKLNYSVSADSVTREKLPIRLGDTLRKTNSEPNLWNLSSRIRPESTQQDAAPHIAEAAALIFIGARSPNPAPQDKDSPDDDTLTAAIRAVMPEDPRVAALARGSAAGILFESKRNTGTVTRPAG